MLWYTQKREEDEEDKKREEDEEDQNNGMEPLPKARSRTHAGKKGEAMSAAVMKQKAECMGECMRDCKEDCVDPEVDEEDKASSPEVCGANCDKDCIEQCDDEITSEQEEVSDGRPSVERDEEEDEPPKWNEGDDEDEEEPADGSGKGVQQRMPAVAREMDRECLAECTPSCHSECEEDPRDAEEGDSPAMARGAKQCKKDCVARCEDDCYIDEGGTAPDDPDRHRMQSDEDHEPPDESDTDRDSHDAMRMDPKEQQLHKMLEGCVDSCEGNCMGKCLNKAGLGMLPLHGLDPEELEGMRDKSGRRLPERAVKGHLFCSEGCSGDCFKLCEQQVSKQLGGGRGRRGERDSEMISMEGNEADDAAVEGGRRAMREGQDYGEERRGRGGARGRKASGRNTVVLPAKLHQDGMLFGSTTWQVALAVICLTTVALGAWSGRRM